MGHLELKQLQKLYPRTGERQWPKKNKKGQSPGNVFHIVGQKSFKVKGKTKPVTTNVKINTMNDGKVNKVNKAFVDVQKALVHFSKGLSLDLLQKQLTSQQCQENKPANVDEATRLMAQL